jgi:hypothetical protein
VVLVPVRVGSGFGHGRNGVLVLVIVGRVAGNRRDRVVLAFGRCEAGGRQDGVLARALVADLRVARDDRGLVLVRIFLRADRQVALASLRLTGVRQAGRARLEQVDIGQLGRAQPGWCFATWWCKLEMDQPRRRRLALAVDVIRRRGMAVWQAFQTLPEIGPSSRLRPWCGLFGHDAR